MLFREKKKQRGGRLALLTVCTCLYACYFCTNFYFRNVNFCSVVKIFLGFRSYILCLKI